MALAGGIGGGTEDVTAPKAQPQSALSAKSEARNEAGAPTSASASSMASASESLSSDEAALVVKGPPDGFVYVTGKPIGRTGERIVTGCGQRFIRVGTRLGPLGLSGVRWLAEGQSVSLPCGRTTTVTAEPSRSKP